MLMEIVFFAVLIFVLGGVSGWFLAKRQNTPEMEERFKGLSLSALKESQTLFLQMAGQTLEKFHEKAKGELEKKHQGVTDLIKPVKESLDKFDGKIQELEKARLGAYVSLKEQVGALVETQKALRQETTNLVTALRAPQVRGRWGEIQLRRVVELAGMLNHCDFFEQESFTTEEQRFRPDLRVQLPGERSIIVDAKAPVMTYLDAIDTQDEEVRKQKLKEYARLIRSHMLMLGRKSYWEQFQRAPEFVVLFLPAETFFSAALEHDPALIEAGVEERVILATPTTLIALLKSIAYGWRQESIAKNAEEISQLGRELYKRIGDMGVHFAKVGKNLESAVDSYNKTVGSFESRVLVTARKFKDLETTGTEKELETLDQIEKSVRSLEKIEDEQLVLQAQKALDDIKSGKEKVAPWDEVKKRLI